MATTARLSIRTARRAGVQQWLVLLMLALVTPAPARAAAPDPGSQPLVREDGGVYRVVAEFTVAQPAAIAVAALTDYENIPRFMPAVRSSTVLERTPGYAVVEQEAIARFMMFSKQIHLVLEIHEQPDRAIRFRDRCGRSFGRYEGAWTIRESAGTTAIRYELTAKPSFEVPEFLLKRLLKRDAALMIEQLRTEIASRAALRQAGRPFLPDGRLTWLASRSGQR